MKLAYLYQVSSSTFARMEGAQVHVVNIIRGLKKRDHDVRLLALHGKGAICVQGLEAFLRGDIDETSAARLGITGSALFRLPERAVRRLQTEIGAPYFALFDSLRYAEAARLNLADVDVIHERTNTLAIGGTIAARRMGKPLILEVNADSIAESTLQQRPLIGVQKQYAISTTRQVYTRASRIICVSNSLKSWLVRTWQLDPEGIDVLPNCADIEQFGKGVQTDMVRQSLGVKAGPIIVFVGGFYPWHDLDTLLHSFRAVRDHMPETHLLLIGHGQNHDRIVALRGQLELDESVIMTGYVPHEKIPEYLAAADIAVSPLVSQPEGYGGSALKLFEYMAAGKPIVATRTGQQAEILENGMNALLAEPGDVDSLTDALLTLLSNGELRQVLGQNARDQAVREHSWDGYARKLERIYEQVLAEHR